MSAARKSTIQTRAGASGRKAARLAAAVAGGAALFGLGTMINQPAAQAIEACATPRIVPVSSASALRTAVASALPGDRIQLADGSYDLDSAVELRRSGLTTAPITIEAATVGGAEITGEEGLKIRASHLVVKGLKFTQGAELSVPDSADHVRLTHNTFQLDDSVKNWVSVSGDDVQVDYNTFQDKSTAGVFLQISGPGKTAMAQRTWVHHNHFLNHTFEGSNGGESIRLGLSSRQHGSAKAVVEHNVFTRANGDPEAISVKSSDNTIRYNRIEKSTGTITLRHGNRNRVEGNLLTGGATGIRVFGNDHTVINNVVQASDDVALQIGAGDIRDDTTYTTKHDAADRVLVAHNTFAYNVKQQIRIGDADEPYGPRNITMANNIVVGSSSSPGPAVRVEAASVSWAGNLLHNAGAGDMPSAGHRAVNPRLVKDAVGLYRLSVDSPAIAAAVGSYDVVKLDVDGQARPAKRSVGADEVSTAPVTHTVVTSARVGPDA